MISETPCLEVEAGQRAVGHRGHRDAQPQSVAEISGHGRSHVVWFGPVDLQPELHLVECLAAIDIHGELAYLAETAHDVLDRAGKDVDAAYHEHIVNASDAPPFGPRERPPAATWGRLPIDP